MRQSSRYVYARSAVEMLGDPCHTRGFIHRYYGLFGEEVPRVVQRRGLRRELEYDEMLFVLTGSWFRLFTPGELMMLSTWIVLSRHWSPSSPCGSDSNRERSLDTSGPASLQSRDLCHMNMFHSELFSAGLERPPSSTFFSPSAKRFPQTIMSASSIFHSVHHLQRYAC